MNDFLAVIAIFIFFSSSYLIYDLFINGFNVPSLIAALIGYILVHFIYPKNTNSDSRWYETIELIFDLPYQAMATTLRALSFNTKKSDIDFDI